MLEQRIPDPRLHPAEAVAYLAERVSAAAGGADLVTLPAGELLALAGCLRLVSIEVERLEGRQAVAHG